MIHSTKKEEVCLLAFQFSAFSRLCVILQSLQILRIASYLTAVTPAEAAVSTLDFIEKITPEHSGTFWAPRGDRYEQ